MRLRLYRSFQKRSAEQTASEVQDGDDNEKKSHHKRFMPVLSK